ncbi:Os02g0483601 [Oryza sativa Japonica Group]|uniref:Os02g0483601 protein n=1 Tax=Oryza sativa subsp. japonica TaxID=39947 RepID=A0A0P0VJ31_ORYSJ|nr:Os02g0483601 [Oryza sativa Japonica Group]
MDERGVGDEPVLMGEVQQVGESNPTLSEASQRTGFTFNSVGHHAMGESSNCNLEGHNVVFRSDREKSEQVTQSNIKVQEPLDSNIVMPFGDISRMFVPPIRGEFTNLLFQAHHETTAAASASWRLEFENQDPNSSTSYD